MILVAACETQPVIVEGLRQGLEATNDLQLVGAVSDPQAFIELVTRESPRICLIDNAFGSKVTFRLIADLKLCSPQTGSVLWGIEFSEADSFGALQAGTKGILKKTLPMHVILDCLRAVANGNIWIEKSTSNRFVGFINRDAEPRLTPREEEILSLVMQGKTASNSPCTAGN